MSKCQILNEIYMQKNHFLFDKIDLLDSIIFITKRKVNVIHRYSLNTIFYYFKENHRTRWINLIFSK